MTQCWWLYLLVCRDGRTYAGIATDVAARFTAHSSGKGAKFTRANPPVRVLGTQSFATRSEALKAEAALKKLDRPKRLAWAQRWAPHPGIEPSSNSHTEQRQVQPAACLDPVTRPVTTPPTCPTPKG